MLGFQEKRNLRRILYSKITLIVLAALFLLMLQATWGVWGKARETRLLKDRHEKTLAELKDRAAALQAEVDRLTSERGIEEEVRSKFDVGREGESVLIITDPKDDLEDTETRERSGFWSSFSDLFR